MTLLRRKILILSVAVGILFLANLNTLVHWMNQLGIVDLAGWIGERYLTGTALAIMVTLIVLTVDKSRTCPVDHSRHCRTCDHLRAENGRYCPHCGSRR